MNLKEKARACRKPGRLSIKKRTYTRNEVIWFSETVAHNEIDETNVDYFFRIIFGTRMNKAIPEGKEAIL